MYYVIGYCIIHLLHYEDTVAMYNVITVHKVIPTHNLKHYLQYNNYYYNFF